MSFFCWRTVFREASCFVSFLRIARVFFGRRSGEGRPCSCKTRAGSGSRRFWRCFWLMMVRTRAIGGRRRCERFKGEGRAARRAMSAAASRNRRQQCRPGARIFGKTGTVGRPVTASSDPARPTPCLAWPGQREAGGGRSERRTSKSTSRSTSTRVLNAEATIAADCTESQNRR